MNEMQDKQYLALELTKITFEHKEGYAKRKDVMENYWYFLEDLTGVFEKVARVDELEKEINTLQMKLNAKTEENPWGNIRLGMLRKILEDGKGDMEPYLYNAIIKIIGE